MRKVYICSPYASKGNIHENVERAKQYSRLAIEHMCIPVTPHIYFTQFMNDKVPIERQIALNIGLELIKECDEVWVFGDPSGGMVPEIELAKDKGIPRRYFTVHKIELREDQWPRV